MQSSGRQHFSFSDVLGLASLPVFLLLMTGCGDHHTFNAEKALFPLVSGENAFSHVEQLTALGPRPVGSDALEKSRVYIETTLKKFGWRVERQTFQTRTPDGPRKFTNLICRFGEDSDAKLFATPGKGLICSHYDTKQFQGFPFVGANDGGSSSGLLIELARVMKNRPEMARDVELVFFDGEEAFGTNITKTDGLYGSKYYAKEMVLVSERKRPRWGVLLDMIGDQSLKIRAGVRIPRRNQGEVPGTRPPKHSVDLDVIGSSLDRMSRWLLNSAKELGYRDKIGISPDYITDDHIPLNVAAGIPVIDLIDFDFDYWHTPGDTIDKISPESLEITGKVTMLLVEKYLLPKMR